MITNNANTEILFIITFSLDDDRKLDIFENFDKSFVDFIERFSNDFNLNRLWDDISKKYAEEMYPKISYIENLLRKIIYYFMGKNVGNDWTEKCLPVTVEDSIQNVRGKNASVSKEDILYYADFVKLKDLLFERYPNKRIIQEKFIEDFKVNVFEPNSIIQDYEYKSNWDRYFQPIVNKENLEENLKKLYFYRCLVAHNRLIREEEKKKKQKN